MADVNYIKHLNAIFALFQKDSRLNPTHISLYLAFFQIWNHNRFRESFHVNREDVMQLSKIGSKSTYHRCTKQLHHYKYLIYLPSHNPFKGSVIKMLKFETTSEQALDLGVPNQGQALVPSNKQYKQIKNSYKLELPKNELEVLDFFKKENWPQLEAQKFYNHYQANGWKIGGKIKMENWHASAKNWMLKHMEISVRAGHIERSRDAKTNNKQQSQIRDNLHTIRNKDYNQPL
ncbi:hypothetical protein FHS04_001275 [Mesoflavibacter sabulilitoris]|uniref:Uncharacterized protein n=1 Tax=Mesoflavibacter zeaxanthinifaciens subsp. sabulilitoris TaxID=1520893 RepID=A0A2T1NAF2_9FLAO|nr:hypothetical protein [Mesoflavibacter zeaxanthinifaciens]MBB3123772.1 hypothetical protein [Mesoflavibacter zeaxanthinifaciens subsp. sabulilitoris]PSG89110.1 hypothetical protein C7H61_09125 [Mesoflavibacter zeaxanthinifaciens subsp. sabulilitoris]